jgi:hypothetical protein
MLEATFRKLTGQLDQSVRFSLGSLDGVLSFRPFAPGDAQLKTFALLTRAVSERRAVRFMYRNRGQVKGQQRTRRFGQVKVIHHILTRIKPAGCTTSR